MPRPTPRRPQLAVGLAVALLGTGAAAVAMVHPGPVAAHRAELTAATCSGPTGAAYVADPGYQGFTAVDTANCSVVQTYNVDDLPVAGDSGDANYDGTAEGMVLHGSTLWFAVTGTGSIASIDTAGLDPSDYSPKETVIPVGGFPEALAVTPDGAQVWVADTGAQTSTSPGSGVAVVSTSSHHLLATLHPAGAPTDVTLAGGRAYVTTPRGLYVYAIASRRLLAHVGGLSDPESVTVAPDGRAVYVTETQAGRLATIDPATDRVVRTTAVGQLPWEATVSAGSATVYVANPDSDTVSVIRAATGRVEHTFPVTGDPDSVALTPDGSQLWVGGDTSGSVTVLDASSGRRVGSIDLGGEGANSGAGLEPTAIVLTRTPTAQGQPAPTSPS